MKFCQPHWDELREAILDHGLGHLIAANGREAASRTKAELEGKATVADFDPLIAAHNMIWKRALQTLGLGIMVGDLCPVCELLKVTPPPPAGHRYATNDEYFIQGPADAVLETCKEMGIERPYPLDPHGLDEP